MPTTYIYYGKYIVEKRASIRTKNIVSSMTTNYREPSKEGGIRKGKDHKAPRSSWPEIAHHTISFEQISVEGRNKKKSTNSHEAHGKKIPKTHTLKFPKTSARTE